MMQQSVDLNQQQIDCRVIEDCLKPSHSQSKPAYAAWHQSPLGQMVIICDHEALLLAEFVERKDLAKMLVKFHQTYDYAVNWQTTPLIKQVCHQIEHYFAGRRAQFYVPLKLLGTPFQQSVWRALSQVKAGQTLCYSALAHNISKPKAVRAVATCIAKNRLAIFMPCHRIIGKNAQLSGYAGGLWRKKWLLAHEKQWFCSSI